jgi:hypothetical protein
MDHDVVIVGGSYAGLAAGLQLARARRSVLVVDSGQARNRFSHEAHGILGHDGRSPAEIRRLGREQLLAYPTVTVIDAKVQRIEGEADGFYVAYGEWESVWARRIISPRRSPTRCGHRGAGGVLGHLGPALPVLRRLRERRSADRGADQRRDADPPGDDAPRLERRRHPLQRAAAPSPTTSGPPSLAGASSWSRRRRGVRHRDGCIQTVEHVGGGETPLDALFVRTEDGPEQPPPPRSSGASWRTARWVLHQGRRADGDDGAGRMRGGRHGSRMQNGSLAIADGAMAARCHT